VSAARAQAAFLRACELDVLVRKPGNVSVTSPGHGMDAAIFLASASAAAAPLFQAGARVGERIETAVRASWAEAGCNTNLGIVLLCAPLALAIERSGDKASALEVRGVLEGVLENLDIEDASCAFRAIAMAQPGGLGAAPSQDVHTEASVGLRQAMALAAERDSIAREYRDGYCLTFDIGLPVLGASPMLVGAAPPDPATTGTVQRTWLTLLATVPDSHIERKHGVEQAGQVSRQAAVWHGRAAAGALLDQDPVFAAWDDDLKARGINPGTTADLTVACLMLATWLARGC
jgi:triphosphoribosyl-dephospho-CoA synthase